MMASVAEILQQARDLAAAGEVDEALRAIRRLPAGDERFKAEVTVLVGRASAADLTKAQKIIKAWRRIAPTSPAPWFRLLEISLAQGQTGRAERCLPEIRRRAGSHPDVQYYTGLVLQLRGRHSEALAAYRRFRQKGSAPEPVVAGRAALTMQRVSQGIYPGSRGRRDITSRWASPEAQLLREAIESWDCFAEENRVSDSRLTSELARAWNSLGLLWLGTPFGLTCFQKAIDRDPDFDTARHHLLLALNYSPDHSPAELFEAHQEQGACFSRKYPQQPLRARRRQSTDALRVAYLSSDFRRHPVCFFLLPVLEHHDRSNVVPYAYSTGTANDAYTRRVRTAVQEFRPIRECSLNEKLDLLARDDIDVLVDLNGHSGHPSIDLLASRGAPLQITWLGYPNTTGLPQVDFRIVDRVTDPEPSTNEWATETLYRMPGVFSVFAPPNDLPEPAEERQTGGPFVLGSFNNLAKLNSGLLELWAKILSQSSHASLLLKDFAMTDPDQRAAMRQFFSERGVDKSQLDFRGYVRDRREHLMTFHEVDLCLDSYPYNGTTTTCESLLMGVPVLTLRGEDHRSRVSASQLASIGRDGWIAESPENYIDRAVHFSRNPDELQPRGAALRDRVLRSSLCDVAGFTRDLERAFLEMAATRAE